MPVKPFPLYFIYTPKFKDNRKRPEAEQFTVKLKDCTERVRISEQEAIRAKIGDVDGLDEIMKVNPTEGAKQVFELRRKNLDIALDVTTRFLISVDNLALVDLDGKEIPIKSAKDIEEHCSDLAIEISNRILNGADAEELKN